MVIRVAAATRTLPMTRYSPMTEDILPDLSLRCGLCAHWGYSEDEDGFVRCSSCSYEAISPEVFRSPIPARVIELLRSGDSLVPNATNWLVRLGLEPREKRTMDGVLLNARSVLTIVESIDREIISLSSDHPVFSRRWTSDGSRSRVY